MGWGAGGMMKGCVRETPVRTRQETQAFPAGRLCKTEHLGCSSSAPPANPRWFPLSCDRPAEPRHICAAVRGRACPPPRVPGSLVLPSLVPCPCPLSQPTPCRSPAAPIRRRHSLVLALSSLPAIGMSFPYLWYPREAAEPFLMAAESRRGESLFVCG